MYIIRTIGSAESLKDARSLLGHLVGLHRQLTRGGHDQEVGIASARSSSVFVTAAFDVFFSQEIQSVLARFVQDMF